MFPKKKPTIDPDDLERFRQEAKNLQQIEEGLNTPFGKFVLKLLGEYKSFAINEFSNKNVSEMDDMQTMAWTYSIRGKIQLLNDIEKKLLSAKADKETLVNELKQYTT